jgi:hypothetical protein
MSTNSWFGVSNLVGSSQYAYFSGLHLNNNKVSMSCVAFRAHINWLKNIITAAVLHI